MDRRRLLRWLGAAGTVGLAGCGGDPSNEPSTDDPTDSSPLPTGTQGTTDRQQQDRVTALESKATRWGLDEVVNLGELGADPTGNQAIDDLIAQHARDGRLLYFPSGTYRLEETQAVSGDVRLGLVGPDASIVPPKGTKKTLLGLGYPKPLSAVFVEGLTFDFRAENTGGRPLFAKAAERVLLRDLGVRGVVDVAQDLFRLDVTAASGTGLVERLRLPDGSTVPGVTGCEVGDDNEGDITFRDCRIEGFPDNGLYANPPEGSIHVSGGFFRNNGVAGIRITTSGPSTVRGAHVRCDDADAVGENMRGIRLRGGHSLLVEDCLVELVAVPSSDGAITVASELESATIRNCRLRVDADGVNGIRVKEPVRGTSLDTRDGPFRFENVDITGSAAGGAAVRASGRKNCSFNTLRIHQPGADRDGIVTTKVDGELVDTCVSVTADPLAFSESNIERRNVRLFNRPDVEWC